MMNILFENSKYEIGQKLFVPQKNKVKEVEITYYDARIFESKNGLKGLITGYHYNTLLRLRRGSSKYLVDILLNRDVYDTREKAEKASKFLPVTATNDEWLLAIGDRDIEDDDSPYHIDNSNFPSCCANMSAARDILLYCKEEGGLIAHDREPLKYLLRTHNRYDVDDPLKGILKQLRINIDLYKRRAEEKEKAYSKE